MWMDAGMTLWAAHSAANAASTAGVSWPATV